MNGYFKKRDAINQSFLDAGEQLGVQKMWDYMHPDEYRRYLTSNPCENCLCRSWCDDPCPKYLAHFKAKMEYIRKRAESQ